LRPQALGNLGQIPKDAFAQPLPRRDHIVGAGRRSADAQHGVALAQKLARDGMEDLVEHGIADLLRAGMLEQRQGEPFAEDGQ